MADRHIFKIAILSHDEPLYEKLHTVFGIDFESSYTRTSGAAFAYSHFSVNDQRLTAQFWMLDAGSQWSAIRNLYLRGASGVIILHDPSVKNATAINKRLLREFVSINRFPVPIMFFNVSKKSNKSETDKFAIDVERWSGYEIPSLTLKTKKESMDEELMKFMRNVRDWRAKNVIFQTLKLYFSLDAINNEKKSISKIITQLRRIYTSHYYELLNDQELYNIIQQATVIEGFDLDLEDKSVNYSKELMENPWADVERKIEINGYNKPKVEKLD